MPKNNKAARNPIGEWNRIPPNIRLSIRDLNGPGLNQRGGAEGWSIREHVHHLVEANLVASNMIIAALATDGANFDWTWVNPTKEWMRRIGYTTADVEPAIKTLRALCRHISALVASQPDALTRTVMLNDTPGGKRYAMTIEQILWQEIDHAGDHLQEIRTIRKFHSN